MENRYNFVILGVCGDIKMIMSLVGLGDIDSMAQNIVDCFACDGQRIIITSDDNPEKMYEYRVVGLFAVSD